MDRDQRTAGTSTDVVQHAGKETFAAALGPCDQHISLCSPKC